MEVWTAEAIKGYYRDPEIAWFEAGLTALGGPLPAPGYYVIHHCGRPNVADLTDHSKQPIKRGIGRAGTWLGDGYTGNPWLGDGPDCEDI